MEYGLILSVPLAFPARGSGKIMGSLIAKETNVVHTYLMLIVILSCEQN
jgi:hypothetical protein